MTTDKMPKSYK